MHIGRALMSMLAWAGCTLAIAAQPYSISDSKDSTGGNSLASAKQHTIVADQANCKVNFFRLNYATMHWEPLVPAVDLLDDCANGELGVSTSVSGDVAVIGLPGWDGPEDDSEPPDSNNYGGIMIFEFNGEDAWNQILGLNDGEGEDDENEGNIQSASDAQIGARFGEAVSVSRDGSSDIYLIAVGAPNHDTGGGANADAGKVYAFSFDAASNTLTEADDYESTTAGSLGGSSVAANHPFILMGIPIFSSVGTDSGVGKLLELNGSVSLYASLEAEAFAGIGFRASLSDDYALMSGLTEAYTWENTGSEAAPVYQLVMDGGAAKKIASNGGDVGQTNPVAFGDSASGAERVRIFPDLANDSDVDGDGDAVIIDLNDVWAGDDLGDAPGNIALNDVTLWVGNAAQDRTLSYQFPCGPGKRLIAFQWELISLPCDLIGKKVFEVFGAVLEGGVYGIDYIVYELDDSIAAEASPYRIMDDEDPLGQDRAYWLLSNADQYFRPSSALSPGFTSVNVGDPPTIAPDTVKRARHMTLPRPVSDGMGGTFARVMVANPFIHDFDWSELAYEGPSGFVDMEGAETNGELLATGYVYDPDPMSGQEYRAISTTPGFDSRIQPYEGFWVRVLAGADNGSNGGILYLPLSE